MSQDADSLESGQPPLQFSLRTLLIVQTLCAVFFALLMMVRIFAILILFLATVIYEWTPARPESLAKKRMATDLLGGLVLPVLCFLADPIVRTQISAAIYLIVGFQLAVLAVWLVAGRLLDRASDIIAGILCVGAFVALVFGCCLLPMALLGLIAYGIGLLALTPFLTMTVFWRNWRSALATQHGGMDARRMWLGMLMAIAVPVAANWFLGKMINEAIPRTQWIVEWLYDAPIRPL